MANLGQVYTKRNVADYMTRLFTLPSHARVLDPCMGGGVFIYSLLAHTTYNVTGVEIDDKAFNAFSNPDTERCHVRKGNFFDETAEYDGIIMNPPYIRQEEIDNLSPFGISKQTIQEACALMPISTKANMYMYFVLYGLQLLRSGGEMVAIFPNAWVNTPLGKQFKEQITRHAQIQLFISVTGNPFEGTPTVDVCIIKLIKEGRGATTYKALSVSGNQLHEQQALPTQIADTKSGSLTMLKNIATIRRGITTGANNLFINPKLPDAIHTIDVLTSPKNLTGYTTSNAALGKMLAIGKDDIITESEQAYISHCEETIRTTGKPLSLKNMIDSNADWYRLKIPSPAPVLFAYIVRRNMKFVYNAPALHARDNFYMITPHHIHPFLLLALLNNYHVYTQLEKKGKTYGNGLLKIQVYDVATLLLPKNLDEKDATKLTKLGKQLVETGDDALLDEISRLLNKHYGKDAKEEYFTLKTKRLGTL